MNRLIRRGAETHTIVRWHEVGSSAQYMQFNGYDHARYFLHPVQEDGHSMATLRTLLAEDSLINGIHPPDDDQVLERIAWALDEGRLRIVKARAPKRRSAGGGGSKPPPPQEATPPPKRKSTVHWVSIKLVDEEGNPVPGVAYEIELPDGTKAKGKLDDYGGARYDGLAAAGQCKVTFPELDKDVWKRG